MSLHLIFTQAGLRSAIPRAADSDQMVLLGDATYSSHNTVESDQLILQGRTFVLLPDAQIRGVQYASTVEPIDYDKLVKLCAENHPIVSWHD